MKREYTPLENTEIPMKKWQRLAIGYHPDEGVTMLYVPHNDHHAHEHIELSEEAVAALHEWTSLYFMHKKFRGHSLIKRFFKEVEHGAQSHRRWLAEKFKEFWGVEVRPAYDGDMPAGESCEHSWRPESRTYDVCTKCGERQ